MERASYTKEQLDAYYKRKIDTMTSRCMIDNAEAKGINKGLEIAAINAHKAGHSIETIAIFTGLTVEQINEILK